MKAKVDDYERELARLEEAGELEPRRVSAAERKRFQEVARNTLKKDARINIRISSRDLRSLQRKATRVGMPYQTLIASVLHRYASGDLREIE